MTAMDKAPVLLINVIAESDLSKSSCWIITTATRYLKLHGFKTAKLVAALQNCQDLGSYKKAILQNFAISEEARI